MWQHQNLWRKPGRRYWWRWGPVTRETPAFWRCWYNGMNTKNSSKYGVEMVWAYETVYVEKWRSGAHQPLWTLEDCEFQKSDPDPAGFCFYFNLIIAKLHLPPWHLQSWGLYFNWIFTKAISWPLMVAYSVTLHDPFMPSKPVPPGNAYRLPSTALGPLDHSFCVLTPGNTPRRLYINDVCSSLIH